MPSPIFSAACALILSAPSAGPAPSPAPAAATPGKPKLLVLELHAGGGLSKDVARAFSEAITDTASQQGYFKVVSTKDIETLLGLERQRQMIGCADDAKSCLAELAGALGARFVLNGTISKLGDSLQLNVQTIDSSRAEPVGRAMRIADTPEALRQQLPYVVAEATGTPQPSPPSRVLPYGLMGGGALVAVVGGLLGFQALSQEGALVRELELGEQQPAILKPSTYYAEEGGRIRTQKTLSVGALIGGAALIGAGFLLNPSDSASGRAKVSLVPKENGLGLVGVW